MELSENAPYCSWLDNQTAPDFFKIQESIKIIRGIRFMHYLGIVSKDKSFNSKDHIIQFGKFKGQTVQWIYKNNPKYCALISASYPPKDEMFLDWARAKQYWEEQDSIKAQNENKDNEEEDDDV